MKEIKGELEKRIDQYSLAFAQLPDSILITDSKFNIVSVNKPFEELFGYTLEEIVGKTPDMLNGEPNSEKIQRKIYDDIATGAWRGSFENVKKDGSTFTCDMTISALKDEQGELFAYVGTQKDITERKKAELELKESEQNLNSLIFSMIEGFCVHKLIRDENGIAVDYRIVSANPAYEKYTGIKIEEVVGKLGTEVYGAKEAPFLERYARVIETGEPDFFDVFFEPLGKHFDISVFSPEKDVFVTTFNDITKKKQSEQELKERNKELNGLYNLGQLVEETRSLDELLPRLAKEIISPSMKFSDRVHIGFQLDKKDYITCHEHKANEIPYSLSAPILIKGKQRGQLIVGYLEDLPFEKDFEKKLVDSYANSLGKTIERFEAEQELKESEKKYKRLFESSRDAIMTLNPPSWLFTAGNKSTLEMFLCEDENDFISRTPDNYSPEYQPDGELSSTKSITMINRAMKEGSYFFEWSHKKSDGQEFPATVLLSRIEEDGLKYLQATVRDITDRKKSEQELKESKTKYKALFESNPDGIITVDITTKKFTYVNPSVCSMLGYTQEELVGMGVMDIHPKDDLEHVISEFEAQGRGDKTLANGIPCLKKDGTIIYADVASAPYYRKGIKYNIGFFRDITERKKTEAQLIEAQKMDSIGNLAGGIAHDFNNLLAASMGYAELLSQEENPIKKRRYIDRILVANERMEELTQKLLGFARRADTTKQAVNLNQVVNGAYSLLEVNEKGIDLEINLGDLVTIDADQTQMMQIVMNLCVNSIDAMQEHETLSINTYTLNGRVHLKVTDTGYGMDEETLKHVYDPYFTTKKTGEVKGTGLGMASVYGIVVDHNAQITIDSVVGKGTTVEISFPSGEKPYKVSGDSYQETGRELDGAQILLVEDDEQVGEMLTDMLPLLGYELIWAKTGEEAVVMFKKNQDIIHAVILDYKLPDFNGDKVYTRMKELADIPTLMVSGFAVDKAQACLDLGVKEFLGKPYRMGELSSALERIMS